MGIKDIKAEARGKLALNMHQAIVFYTIEYAIFTMLLVIIVLSCVSIGSMHLIASIVFIAYGCILMLAAIIGMGIFNHAMVDFYLASYKCKPYNIRRLGDTLARNGLTKILTLNLKRVLLSVLLLICLIVPGVIYLIRTSMASNLLVANPKMKASTSLSASSKVMAGKTGSYFSLMISMFGWWLLGVATFGLGYVFIMPYINMCKTVYYKRILQGDKTIYQTIVQPVSPLTPQQMQQMQQAQMQQAQMQQMQMQQAQMRQAQMQQAAAQPQYGQNTVPPTQPSPQQQAAQPQGAQVVPPIQLQPQHAQPEPISAPLPPIDALDDEDMTELNAAMQDLESEPTVVDVPEVAISPVATTMSNAQPSMDTDAMQRKVDNSDFIETVKPLTTREVEESDVMSRKIDMMFSGASTHNIDADTEKHDYLGIHKSGPNDFVTRESDDFDDSFGTFDAAPAEAKVENVDDAFDDFMKSFDAPQTDGEFKPLTRTPKSIPVEELQVEEVKHTTGTTKTIDGESRVERLRREREERRKNLGK